MVKIYMNKDGSIAKYEQAQHNIIYMDFDINDTIVVCEKTGEICRLQDSEQGKSKLKELKSKQSLDKYEQAELEFLSKKASETSIL